MDEFVEFENACDEMSGSKFVFIDKNISKVLKSIAKSQSIMNVISDSMIGFNFGKELKTATSLSNIFSMPNDDDRCIALIFCTLNAIDDKKIDINQLLSKYFLSNGEDSYRNFCNLFIIKFKDKIKSKLKFDDQNIKKEDTNLIAFSKESRDRILFLSDGLLKFISKNNKLDNEIFECFKLEVKENNLRVSKCLYDILKNNYLTKKSKEVFKEIDVVFDYILNGELK